MSNNLSEEEFDELMFEKYLPQFKLYLSWFVSGFYKDHFLAALDDYLRPTMIARAKDYDDKSVYSTMSDGDYMRLDELLEPDENLKEGKYRLNINALLNILYRYFYWSWGSVDNANTEEWLESEHDQILELVETYV